MLQTKQARFQCRPYIITHQSDPFHHGENVAAGGYSFGSTVLRRGIGTAFIGTKIEFVSSQK